MIRGNKTEKSVWMVLSSSARILFALCSINITERDVEFNSYSSKTAFLIINQYKP